MAEVLLISGLDEPELSFTAHLLPIDRGILETIYVRTRNIKSAEEFLDIYLRPYRTEKFVRLYKPGSLPDLAAVNRTNFCDIGFKQSLLRWPPAKAVAVVAPLLFTAAQAVPPVEVHAEPNSFPNPNAFPMRTRLFRVGLIASLALCSSSCRRSEQPDNASSSSSDQKQGAAAGSAPKGAVLLKVKWPMGNRYVYRLDLDQQSTNKIPQAPTPIQQNVTMAMTYALSVVKETPEGEHDLEMSFLANEMEVKMGGQTLISFDSKENPKDAPPNPMTASLRKMIGSKLRMQLAADGKVKEVVGLDEWVNNVAGDNGGPMTQMLNQQFNEAFFRQITDFGKGLSSAPVQPGQSWPFKMEIPAGTVGKIAIDATIKLKRWEEHESHHCALLETKGTMKGTASATGPMGKMSLETGKITGTSWFDPELGALVDSSSDQSMRIKGEMPAPPGQPQPGPAFTSDLAQKVSIKLVELGKAEAAN